MREIFVTPKSIVRATVLGLALLSLAACGGGFFAPSLKIKGSVDAPGWGSASGCQLSIYSLRTGERVTSTSVGGKFSYSFSSKYIYDSDRKAYQGLQFTVGCAKYPYSTPRIFSDEQMAASGNKIDLGKFRVWDGDVRVSGKVFSGDGSGKKRRACLVHLYTDKHKFPLKTWTTLVKFTGNFNLSRLPDTATSFFFKAECAGSDGKARSKTFEIAALDPKKPRIKTGTFIIPR